MRTVIIVLNVILLWMQTSDAHQIYAEPLQDPLHIPSDGILINENVPLHIARKDDNGKVVYLTYRNIIKPSMEYAVQLSDYNRSVITGSSRKLRHDFNQASQNPYAPAVLYPELMIVIANDLYEHFNRDIWRVVPYVVAFYSGVDIVYQELQNPRIRLNIAAIIIEEEYGVFENLESSSIASDQVRGDSLSKGTKFWYQQKDVFPMDSYDAIVAMTLRRSCVDDSPSGEEVCGDNVRGRAYVSSMCRYSDEYEETHKLAIVTDEGKFLSIYVAAHELAHLLGASHDGTRRASEIHRFNDIPRCKRNASDDSTYIMYPSSSLISGHRFWSDCTLDYFQRFLREVNHTCLHNVPATGKHTFPRFFPGKIIGTSNDLCKLEGYGKSCEDPKDPCGRLQCEKSETDDTCLLLVESTLDGISCDKNDPTKFCMAGQCVTSSDLK